MLPQVVYPAYPGRDAPPKYKTPALEMHSIAGVSGSGMNLLRSRTLLILPHCEDIQSWPLTPQVDTKVQTAQPCGGRSGVMKYWQRNAHRFGPGGPGKNNITEYTTSLTSAQMHMPARGDSESGCVVFDSRR